MTPHLMPRAKDPTRPLETTPVTITVDGSPVIGVLGQSIAGVIMADDTLRLRDTRRGRPRGVLCGIGVCFECLVTVNGASDVRACQRLARDGDDVLTTVQAPSEPASAADDEGMAR